MPDARVFGQYSILRISLTTELPIIDIIPEVGLEVSYID